MNIIFLFLLFLPPVSVSEGATVSGIFCFGGGSLNTSMDIKTSKKLFPSQRQMGKTSAPTHWHLHGGGGHWEPVKTRTHTRSMAHAWAATTVYGGIILIFFEAFITALFVLVLWSVQPIFRT